jgi:hypothetical protein
MPSFAILLNRRLEPIYQIPMDHMKGGSATEFIIHKGELYEADLEYKGPRRGFNGTDWVYRLVTPELVYSTKDYYAD